MPRPHLNEDEIQPKAGNYFIDEKTNLEFISTGCTLLDCVLGGGYVLGRITNIIGDKSTGKTLLAMEAAANFIQQYPDGRIFYRESEAAFDDDYAAALGIPIDKIERDADIFTVEDMFEDITEKIKECEKANVPSLYITDSLDALSDRDELKRDIDKGSFGAAKAKLLSSLFRQRVQPLKSSRMCWLVISQVRDNIGVMFGPKNTRSGGRALDFYASQIIELAQVKRLEKERNKIKRVIGVKIKARTTKNKITMPYQSCEFDILFGYGVDDEVSNMDWLNEVDAELPIEYKDLVKLPRDERLAMDDKIAAQVRAEWREIASKFLPDRGSKY